MAARRQFLVQATGAAFMGAAAGAAFGQRRAPVAPRAIAFDAFPIFDPRPVEKSPIEEGAC